MGQITGASLIGSRFLSDGRRLAMSRVGGRGFGRRQFQFFAHEDAVTGQMICGFQGLDVRSVSLGNAAQGVTGFDHINTTYLVRRCLVNLFHRQWLGGGRKSLRNRSCSRLRQSDIFGQAGGLGAYPICFRRRFRLRHWRWQWICRLSRRPEIWPDNRLNGRSR